MFSLTYKSIDVMKKTLDAVTNQLTTAEKTNLVACLATTGITHIAIEVPMDTNAGFIANGSTPSPRTVEAETQEWCDIIHAAGLKVMHRGCFCGTNTSTNYNFPWRDYNGGDALPVGDATSAPTDGEDTWCGKLRRYILTNVGESHWESGDIFAPMYEPTSHAFDGHAWWTDGNTTGFKNTFIAFKATADAAFSSISKTVPFQTHNNFSEVRSGWVDSALFTDQNFVGFDYYGNDLGGGVEISDYLQDFNTQYTAKNKPLGVGEWGDIGNEAIPRRVTANIYDRMHYLINFYKMLRDNFVDTDKLTTFNYWGGWEGQNTSILKKSGSGASSVYSLNARGQILAAFYRNQSGMTRVPVIQSGDSDDTYSF